MTAGANGAVVLARTAVRLAAGAGSGGQGGQSAILGATPPMGWNSWNTFACDGLSETLIKGVADTFVSSGMKDAGYQYVNLDDCWMNGRDGNGKIQVNTSKFPSGMAALAQYIHDKGLKMGLYSTPGTKTCANIYSGYTGGSGSLGYEKNDAESYASWGVDYLKYDKCTASLDGFAVMRDALRNTDRPIFYSINPGDGTGCVPGQCSIAVDQDPLGIQGKVVVKPGANLEVWAKKLSGTNTVAVALFNRGSSAASMTAQWTAVGLPAGAAVVRDLWAHMDLGSFDDSYTSASVPSHGVVMLKITTA
jgi:hypothetical protein